jgi:flavin-dependent dehydrogenase
VLHPDAPPDLGEWHAVRQYFDDAGDGRLWVIFDAEVLPGYAWVFPLGGGRANVGFGVLRSDVRSAKRGRDLKALWPELLARPALQRALGPDARPSEPVRAWPIPTRYEAASLAEGRVLFVGDAARVVDPMTGEGIAQALESGMLAARAIARDGDVAARYRADVARALGRDLRFASALQRILRHPLGARAALRAVDLNDWTRRQFGRWMFEDYPRAALLTPSRWRSLRSASA